MKSEEQWPDRPLSDDERAFIRILAAILSALCTIALILSAITYGHASWVYGLGAATFVAVAYFMPRSKP